MSNTDIDVVDFLYGSSRQYPIGSFVIFHKKNTSTSVVCLWMDIKRYGVHGRHRGF